MTTRLDSKYSWCAAHELLSDFKWASENQGKDCALEVYWITLSKHKEIGFPVR